ncbi:MAG: Grx4 family monothiol glutaredoxin [Gammaproteobacteria bacterium]
MSVSSDVRERIESAIAANKVVLYMKGTRNQPQCGFSATVVGILDNLLPDYGTVNVLEDPEIREGIKAFSNWPTIPQLYVDNEFLGGCDVIQQMYNSGQLHETLGLAPVSRQAPSIKISDAAAAAIKQTTAQHQGMEVHLKISPTWQHEFSMAPQQSHEIKASDNDIDVYFDLDSAARADGLSLDLTEDGPQTGFVINNPNAPPPVQQMSVDTLKGLLDSGDAQHFFDVRGADERAIASIPGATMLDDDSMQQIEALPKDEMLIFICHQGGRSQQAAEYFRQQGFTNVHNVSGGIDAWSQNIDPSVARY